MRSTSLAPATRLLLAIASIGALGVGGTGIAGRPQGRVSLVGPFAIVSSGTLSPSLRSKLARLGRINPDRPLADDSAGQTLSMFGREDQIAATSNDYRQSHCAALPGASDVLGEIASRARTTSIVIINEAHERSEHRGFIAEVARRLRPLGYDTLAIETLTNNPASTPARYLPMFIRQPKLAYFTDNDGYYLSEAGFGRLGRQAKALGYRLVPYEFIQDGADAPGTTQDQQVARREEGQARTLAAYFRGHPGAKMLVYVGYSHAAEVPLPEDIWLAARLKGMTEIDPLTISQTTCRGGGDEDRLAVLPASEPKGEFDLVVDHPGARFVRRRPAWRVVAGDRPVDIPRALWPTSGWRVVEARPVGEPVASVPMDRVAIRPGEDVALMLPPGRYQLRGIDVAYVPKQ